jgi:uncharacterized protein YecT (DUF1311 family)
MNKVDEFNKMFSRPSGHFIFKRVQCHRCGIELYRQAGSHFTCVDCQKKRANERAEELKQLKNSTL